MFSIKMLNADSLIFCDFLGEIHMIIHHMNG